MVEPISVHSSSASFDSSEAGVPRITFTEKRCTLCGAPRLSNGVCSLVGGPGRGCPDPTFDQRAERAERENEHRQSLICELLFASRRLAEHEIRVALAEDGTVLADQECQECQFAAYGGKLQHAAYCRVGRVLNILDRICATQVDEPHEPTPIRKETAQTEEPARAEAGASPRSDFNEPWTAIADKDEIIGWERIAACVNFCQGIPTEILTAEKPLADLTRSINQSQSLARAFAWFIEVAR